jgi:hypothetical protein
MKVFLDILFTQITQKGKGHEKINTFLRDSFIRACRRKPYGPGKHGLGRNTQPLRGKKLCRRRSKRG